MSDTDWSTLDFDEPKVRPPALTVYQELMRYSPLPPSALAELTEISKQPKKRGRPRKRPAEDA